MWLSKFLDMTDDIEELRSKIKENLFEGIKKKKLTPLEFTILESVFNQKAISGYDLIETLNRTFAGTWEATSGTVYPILSKLKKNGFLGIRNVKSPIGPLRKVYYLTKAGEELLKIKVNKNFFEQLRFTENFLLELTTIYIHSFPEEERKERIIEVQNLVKETLENVMNNISTKVEFKSRCPECGSEVARGTALYCPYCGKGLYPESGET